MLNIQAYGRLPLFFDKLIYIGTLQYKKAIVIFQINYSKYVSKSHIHFFFGKQLFDVRSPNYRCRLIHIRVE